MIRFGPLLLLACIVSAQAIADVPGCEFCECSLDETERLLMVPDSEGHPVCEFTVRVIDGWTCNVIPYGVVEVLVGGMMTDHTRICDGYHAVQYADSEGLARFRIPGGGCYRGPDAVVIRANGVPCREYDVVLSPDYAGWDFAGEPNLWDLAVDPVDLAAFATAYQGGTGPASCHDYDNNGTTDPQDLAVFVAAYRGGTTNCLP